MHHILNYIAIYVHVFLRNNSAVPLEQSYEPLPVAVAAVVEAAGGLPCLTDVGSIQSKQVDTDFIAGQWCGQ